MFLFKACKQAYIESADTNACILGCDSQMHILKSQNHVLTDVSELKIAINFVIII